MADPGPLALGAPGLSRPRSLYKAVVYNANLTKYCFFFLYFRVHYLWYYQYVKDHSPIAGLCCWTEDGKSVTMRNELPPFHNLTSAFAALYANVLNEFIRHKAIYFTYLI